MKQVYKFDSSGNFVEPVVLYPDKSGEYTIPADCTDKKVPQPCWKPVFQNGVWIETATEEEKNPVLPPLPPTELDLVKQENEQLKKRVEETENAILVLMDASLL